MFFEIIAVIAIILSILSVLCGVVSGTLNLCLCFLICFVGVFLLWVISCSILTLFVNTEKPCQKHSRIFRWYANGLINLLKQILRIRVHVTGVEKLPKESFLMVGNHRSGLDPLLEMGVLRKFHLGFVAKQELFKIPVIGKVMHKCFCLSLNRSDAREGLKTITQAAEIIKKQTASVGIYPEGTRNYGEELLPFKGGAFKIAQKAKCPIVVVSIRNSDLIMKHVPFRHTDVYIDIADVIFAESTAGQKSAEISSKVRNILEHELYKR